MGHKMEEEKKKNPTEEKKDERLGNKNFIDSWVNAFNGIIYATTDEIHQYFVIGRSGEVADVFLDGIGVVTGVIMVWLCTKPPS